MLLPISVLSYQLKSDNPLIKALEIAEERAIGSSENYFVVALREKLKELLVNAEEYKFVITEIERMLKAAQKKRICLQED